MNPNTQLLASGQHPSGENFFHILLKSVEADASHLLTVFGNKATIHKILATGEVISTEFGIPVLKEVLAGIDSFVGQ